MSAFKSARVDLKNSDFLTNRTCKSDKIPIKRSENGVWTFSAVDATAVSSLLIAASPFLSLTNYLNTSLVVLPRLQTHQINNASIVHQMSKSGVNESHNTRNANKKKGRPKKKIANC